MALNFWTWKNNKLAELIEKITLESISVFYFKIKTNCPKQYEINRGQSVKQQFEINPR